MSVRSRAALLVLAVLALVAATVTPARAQEVENYYLGTDASALSLTVLGNEIGTFAGTSSVAEQTPSVVTESFGFRSGDNAIGMSEASVSSAGAAERDPEGEAIDCGVPALPEALPIASLISLVDVCSVSFASLDAAALPDAVGEADAGRLAVNGQLLADLIFGLLLDPILAQLDTITAPLDEAIIGPVDAALAQVCENLPPELSPGAIIGAAEESGLPVADVIGALPNGSELLEAIGDECLLSLATIVDLTGVVVSILEDEVRAALLDALDRDLLEIVLGTSESTITTSGGTAAARTQLEALSVSSPSLGFLIDAIRALVAETVQGGIDDVTAVVPEQLASVVAAIPDLGDVLDQILALLPLDDLVDDAPLLSIAVAQSVADARMPLGGGSVDTSQSAAGAIVIDISPAIAALLGIPAQTTVAPGVTLPLAEGTPLESSIKVGTVEQVSDVLGTAGVSTSGARVAGTELALLTGIEGGIVLTVAEAVARVGGTAPEPEVLGTLPRTGSNDAGTLLAAVGLGVVALGVLALRRRAR